MGKRVKAIIRPEVLVWCRTSAGFSIADAEKALGKGDGRIAAWEEGKDSPSIPQLRKLASLYKRPLAVFYLQEVPKDFQVLRDLRRLPETGQRAYTPDLLIEMRRAEQQRELALELLSDMGDEQVRFSLAARMDEDPELVAPRIREALGITSEVQSRWGNEDGRTAFNRWRSRIERMGVLVFQATRFSSEEASGFAIAGEVYPVIVVNRKDAPRRRTFSLVHELAHLMLRISGVSDFDSEGARPPEDQQVEVFCNRVAAATLIPRDELLSHGIVRSKGARATSWTNEELSELGRLYGVSREAVLRRLLTFNLTTEAFYRETRAALLDEFFKQRERQREQKKEIRRNMPQETLSNLGRPLVSMILVNYYQDRLTLSDVAGYLGIKTRHIAKLEQFAGLRPQ